MGLNHISLSFLFLILSLICSLGSTQFLPMSIIKSTQYEEDTATTSWYLSIAAYCSKTNIEQWKVSTTSTLFPRAQDITVFTNSTGDNQGYSAYSPTKNLIFLAIRGSSNIENWMENLDVLKTTYPYCSGCEVHTGFYLAYHDIKAKMMSSMVNLYQKHPSAKILITGHSLGAAIATLAFVDLYSQFGKIDYFYTFGSPRVGNENFANYLNKGFGDVFKARVTHYKDPVPRLPFQNMGFLHIDREVFYNEASSQYILCNVGGEDPSCANQFPIVGLSVPDHLDYLAISQSSFKQNCQ